MNLRSQIEKQGSTVLRQCKPTPHSVYDSFQRTRTWVTTVFSYYQPSCWTFSSNDNKKVRCNMRSHRSFCAYYNEVYSEVFLCCPILRCTTSPTSQFSAGLWTADVSMALTVCPPSLLSANVSIWKTPLSPIGVYVIHVILERPLIYDTIWWF